MGRPRKDAAGGPKLSPEARKVLIGRIVAGDSNQQVLAYLDSAGFPSDLSRTTLATYRKMPEVVEAVNDINVEYSQSALAVRGRRIKVFNNVVDLLQKKLGLNDSPRNAGRLGVRIETGGISPHESENAETEDAAPLHAAPLHADEEDELTVKEVCELSKTLVIAMEALNRLLADNGRASVASPTGIGAFDPATPISQVETQTSRRALLNDILEEAMREEEEEERAKAALAEMEAQPADV
jgi:hypothetical protein